MRILIPSLSTPSIPELLIPETWALTPREAAAGHPRRKLPKQPSRPHEHRRAVVNGHQAHGQFHLRTHGPSEYMYYQ